MDTFKPSKMWELRYALKLARANAKRAHSRHVNEQAKGQRDMSVKQTRRMALAVQSWQRASFKYRDALHNLRCLSGNATRGRTDSQRTTLTDGPKDKDDANRNYSQIFGSQFQASAVKRARLSRCGIRFASSMDMPGR
jgi:hypothetical protein